MKIKDVFQYYESDLKQVEACMETHLGSEVALIPEVIHHLIGSGGKRFRPLLLMASSELCSYTGERRYSMSAIVEFIHTATLLHDDVIDSAETRRGKVSANNVWGNAASVLIGDFLYSKAFRLMTDDGNLAVMKIFSLTTNVMSEGEVFQLIKCGDLSLTEAEYFTIIEKKTSILIAAACSVGGILGNAGDDKIHALRKMGLNIGSAFQITDDTLDYMAREDEFGKAVGKDLGEGKMTLPLIRTLSRCTSPEREQIRSVIQKKEFDPRAVADIIDLIQRYDGIDYALNKAQALISDAKGFLAPFPDGFAKEAIYTIADYVIEGEHSVRAVCRVHKSDGLSNIDTNDCPSYASST